MFRFFLLLLLAFPIPALAEPITVAILYFDSQGNPELEPLKVGLAQMMITDLVGTEGVTVVEREKVQAVLDELELGHSGIADATTAAQVGKVLGAQWMIFGSYFALGNTLRIDARMVKVETTEIPYSHGVSDKPANFMGLEQELASKYRQTFAEVVAQAGQTGAVTPAPTPSPAPSPRTERGETATAANDAGKDETVVVPDEKAVEAAVAYSEGLIYLDRKDVDRARESFQVAVTSDPNLDDAKTELAKLEI